MASRPTVLKSYPHSCVSGYLCTPQKVLPHLHGNPNNPTFLLHMSHLFFTGAGGGPAVVSTVVPAASESDVNDKDDILRDSESSSVGAVVVSINKSDDDVVEDEDGVPECFAGASAVSGLSFLPCLVQ